MTIHYRVIAETKSRGMHFLTPDGVKDEVKLFNTLDEVIEAVRAYMQNEEVEIISIGRVIKCHTLKN